MIRVAGKYPAAILILWMGLLAVPPIAEAQTDEPLYPHPLFTGPERTAPERDVDYEHLELRLALDLERRRAHGAARYRSTALADSLHTVLLFSRETTIHNVERFVDVDSLVALEHDLRGDSLLVFLNDTLRAGTDFEFVVTYTSAPSRGMYFFGPDRANPDRRRQVWTQGQPEDNRHWLPIFDSPGERLAADLYITVPPGISVLSNGEYVREWTEENGEDVTVHFRQTMPHAPYLFSVVAGEYEVVRDMLTLPGARQIPLQFWIYPERIGDVYRTFGRTPDMLAFFGRLLDHPYPWEKYAQAVVQEFPFGGMENTSATTLSDQVLIDERAALDYDPDFLIAHEVAHQWFGNLITASYWDHIWLNEGFATYFAALFMGEEKGENAFLLRMSDARSRYLAEAATYRRPLVWNRWEDPINMFDAHAFSKGAWVLHMLRHQIGEASFDRVIRRYVRTHAFEQVETHHLEAVVADVTAQDHSRFFDQWVYGAGHPVLDVAYEHDFSSGSLTVHVRQLQEGPMVADAFRFDTHVKVQVLGEEERFDLPIRSREQTFAFPVSMRPDFLVFDPGHSVLAEVRISQPAINWVRQLRSASSPLARLQAARALVAFRDDPALLLGLREALSAEPEPRVRAAIVETIGHLPASQMVERSLDIVLDDEDAGVRRAAIRALGNFEGSSTAAAHAMQAAETDESYQVVAEAVRTLARLDVSGVLDVVRSALVTPSHREVTRAAAFDALEILGTPAASAWPLAGEWTAVGRPVDARIAATRFLGTLAARHQPSMRRLTELAADSNVRVRLAAVEALDRAGTAAARSTLQRLATNDPDGRVRAAAAVAIHREE